MESEWMKEMMAKNNKENPVRQEARATKLLFKAYPVSNYKCCQNPHRITSYDGNRTQTCQNCDWSITYP